MYAFEAPFLIRPFVKMTLSALGSSFLKGFKMMDLKVAKTEFGGLEYVPQILGGMNPVRGLVPAPEKRVTVRDIGVRKGFEEEKIKMWEELVSRTSSRLRRQGEWI